MSEKKHSPTPWAHISQRIEDANGEFIIAIGANSTFMPPGTAEANGNLVAAAPDLLSIAEGVRVALSYPRGSEAQVRCLEEVGQEARAAIKKATGGK